MIMSRLRQDAAARADRICGGHRGQDVSRRLSGAL